jgi:predicted SprT family Zn-dependent metalloprotease
MQASFALSPGRVPGVSRAQLLALGRARGWVQASCSAATPPDDADGAAAHARSQVPHAARAALVAGALPEVKALSPRSPPRARPPAQPRRSPRTPHSRRTFAQPAAECPTFCVGESATARDDEQGDTDEELERLALTLSSAVQFRKTRAPITPPSPLELPFLDLTSESEVGSGSDSEADADIDSAEDEARSNDDSEYIPWDERRTLDTIRRDIAGELASSDVDGWTVLKGQQFWLPDMGHAVQSRRSSLTRASFTKQREGAAQRLLDYFDAEVLDGAMSGVVTVRWNNRLLKTAGLTYMRQRKNTVDAGRTECGADGCDPARTAVIELSTKVVDEPFRLYHTLAHEACHAAAWIVDGVARPPHGARFQTWAQRFHRWDPALSIARCHNYAIRFRYTYTCTQCAYEYGRHSKSIDTSKQVCGKCKSTLKLKEREKHRSRPQGPR